MMLPPWLAPIYQQLVQLAWQQQLHHALLFCGPQGVGKQLLAEQVAHFLMCQQPVATEACGICKSCLLFKAGHHPDLHRVTVENSIGVDQIRDISQFMQGAPQQGGARVVLLPSADKMTEAAANALLKTLEEPGQNSFLVLQTAHDDLLLPTIISRCQRWFVSPQLNAQTQQWLQQQSTTAVPAYLLDYCSGAPLKALTLLQTGQVQTIESLLSAMQQFLADGKDVLALVKKLESEPEITQLLGWFIRQYCYQHQHPNEMALLQRYMQWCRDEQSILGQNKHLALTSFMLDFYKLLH